MGVQSAGTSWYLLFFLHQALQEAVGKGRADKRSCRCIRNGRAMEEQIAIVSKNNEPLQFDPTCSRHDKLMVLQRKIALGQTKPIYA
mmetsp:Transcript_1575/g.9711  ORF Transcript_1575/g.9711 Transcript_1575/m.9711 type:complete len:87 (-) Transcript_1575:2007-2267(-)